MQRPNRHYRSRDGDGRNRGRNRVAPPPSHSQQQPPADYRREFLSQNPAFYPQFPQHAYQFNPYFPNPNLQFQDPNLFQHQFAPSIPIPDFVASTSNVDESQFVNFPTETPPPREKTITIPPVQKQSPQFPSQSQRQPHNLTPNRRESLGKIEAAVEQARGELVASGKNVSTWKVVQSALVKLKVESWDSLGFQLQQVPSLLRLIALEGSINAFIHCFVAVRAICSLHDLQVAICQNEGVEKFEELQLGPFIQHPLIEHYFSSKDMNEVYKITDEEIISHLRLYVLRNKGKIIDIKIFLQFVADKCKVHDWEKMGLRIQRLGKHIKFIRDAINQDDALIKTFLKKEKDTSSSKRARKRPLFSLEKKQIDERCTTITQHVDPFSSAQNDIRGKHRLFNSSGSDYDSEQRADHCNKQKELLLFSDNTRIDKASDCPYLSTAEEMMCLGLRGENNSSPAACILKDNDEPAKKKRKLERRSHRAKDEACLIGDPVLSNDAVRIFITTWKEACRQYTATEVFEKMLKLYNTTLRQRRIMRLLFSSGPFLGLLNVAVMSIKNGSWDSIYDTFQSFDDDGTNANSNKCIEYEQLDIELGDDLPGSNNHKSVCGIRVTIEDINRKVAEYFANERPLFRDGKSPPETMIMLARKLLLCEVWLNQQFSIKNFDSLGHGEYLTYLEKNISQLPKELHGNLNSQVHEQFPFEASLLKEQFVALLSQASDSLWEGGSMTKHRITDLLSRQFPFITFNVTEKGYADNSLCITEHESNNCVLFSATLLGLSSSCDSADNNGNRSLDFNSLGVETSKNVLNAVSFTPKEAVEVLLGAPMLVDLNSCLHWDAVYAPSLGPLVTLLLTEVSTKDLLCLLTRDSKIIRIDPLASPKTFYKALLQGSSFQVAVELLSLFALNGGVTRLPSLLLKDHVRQAFEVLLTLPMARRPGQGNNEGPCFTSGTSICKKQDDLKEATSHLSKLVIDCLGYLPTEFTSLAADILLSGLQSVVKCAPSSVLLQCKSNEQRLMLHEVGFALGIIEWIDDHRKLCPIVSDQSCMPIPALPTGSLGSGLVELRNQQELSAKMLLSQEAPSVGEVEPHDEKTDLSSFGFTSRDGIQDDFQLGEMKDANLVIDSIRREEFGLGSNVESTMLEKQHARLGRALHCLSQELYSQDSHFLLELIQNADDNSYHEEVQPTLMFILQNDRIIVLNNEKGFTAQNIRALCDVGNSTKKGSSSGYIGQKGIGFKSVFRVTNAPEIHSNGFHIKFDITEGQIGFVLPTAVPPCNIDLIKYLGSVYPDQMDTNCWNTCMVLPFRSRLTQGLEMSKIISMFSDIHPSLLLFLHRLQCIKLINMLDNSYLAMQREILGDGLVKVSFGDHKMTWFIASKKLSSESIRPGVQATEISIALTLKESENGKYEPHLEQQPVFAFLPLRTYGLKFIIQGDFVLPSSREEVDGDSSWNQWLLSEFPDLFVSAEKSFCSLSCFRENPGKAVAAYMHFVPLTGEVQGFFYGLPRMIISRLRQSDCLLEEGCDKVWVPPCNVLRSWDDHARVLLPDVVLREHLGLGFLDKNIILPDSLARALGIQEYGPKILVQFLSSICCVENGLKSMGFKWLSLCLNEIHVMLNSPGKSSENSSFETDLISSLRKVPFLPLSDGTYGSTIGGTIWLNIDAIKTGADGDTDSKTFPNLYASLRIVCPSLFSSVIACASWVEDNFVSNIASLLHKIGVQHLTAHEIIKSHILPIISDDKLATKDTSLCIECYAFLMLHLQSNCLDCRVEKELIISEVQSKALMLTNQGFKRLREVAIHFGKGFGNSIDVSRLIRGIDYKWHEIDESYLRHPIAGSISVGLMQWRDFFHNLGVTDFVKVTQTERNICDVSHIIFQQVKWDKDLMSSGMVLTDWESQELDLIISSLARSGNLESSTYLLEVLDAVWDDYFSDKTACYLSCSSGENNTFKSSCMNNICDVRWVASNMGKELHYPRDLFNDCDAVRSILGNFAPYVTPKIRNKKLVADIGFKTQVTIDDILASLQKWRTLTHFKASVSQMSRLYTFLSKELATSKKEVMEAFSSGPFIFVPCTTGGIQEEVVAGLLLSPEEVYWHDRSGALVSVKQHSSAPDFYVSKILCDIYPGLHDFFVNVCGVNETPPFRFYLQILKQISNSALPLEAASDVFQVFLHWSDGIRCGAMVDDDIFYLRDHLLMLDYTVLPALQDKWISLHPSFGLVCWVDDDSLKEQFKHSDKIEFLHFGELTGDENEMLQTKVSVLLKKLGIPALSEVVTREAIYYGPSDSSFKSSLVTWALPFAQRYIYKVHSEKYNQLKLSGFEKLQGLRIVVVETLFYRNAIKNCGASSKNRSECSCLLQDTILYITQESDTHSLFMELSRLFFDGVPELHLANFLHMLTTMAESGSTEDQMEFFILNSQKMPKISDDEPIWSLSSSQVSNQNSQTHIIPTTSEPPAPSSSNSKKKTSWPPAGWKNAPGFEHGYLSTDFLTPNHGWNKPGADVAPAELNEDYIIEEDVFPETSSFSNDFNITDIIGAPSEDQTKRKKKSPMAVPTSILIESHCPEDASSKPTDITSPDAQQASFIGRLGESVAFRHLKGKNGDLLVKWMNEQKESGLPYDITIGENENDMEFIEVKATRYSSKNWFKVSIREWQFAVEKGDRYSVAHIVLSTSDTAKMTIYKNPAKLCQSGILDLAVMMPRQQQFWV